MPKAASRIFLCLFLTFVLLLALLAAGCGDALTREVVATVNGDEIVQSELDDFVKLVYLFMPEYQEMYSQGEYEEMLKEEILWLLVENRVLQQEIRRLELPLDEEEIEELYREAREELIEDIYGSEDDYKEQVEELGLEEDFIRSINRSAYLRDLLFEHLSADLTDDDIRQFVEENPSFLEMPSFVYAYHILLESEEEAGNVLQKLEEGEDFVEVGVEHSLDTFVELGRISSQDMLDPLFLEAAFELEPGEISGPVQTSFGYHIIKITEKEEAGEMSFEEVKEDALETLVWKTFEEYLQKLLTEAEVEIL